MLEFWACFVPLFVAVDAVGVLPLFLGFTRGMGRREMAPLIFKSVLSATLVAGAFVLFGTELLVMLGITVDDFMVAGGAVLFVIALSDLVSLGGVREPVSPGDLGVVPLGIPLIAGPAVLTTAMLQRELHGVAMTLAALAANTALAGAVFSAAGPLNRVLGVTGAKIVSKIANLLLAAIAVMLIRRGVAGFLGMG
ncbi:MarC family protein [Fundidesulfovibrio terrae]|uniref:MarC family protein n=1 Tax=Fundidesulfovibrio terrae TaxID=2922866 RepID=UPI001FAF6EB8|nr:MarC family protein [Fundidesulfovibrio terrae]